MGAINRPVGSTVDRSDFRDVKNQRFKTGDKSRMKWLVSPDALGVQKTLPSSE